MKTFAMKSYELQHRRTLDIKDVASDHPSMCCALVPIDTLVFLA